MYFLLHTPYRYFSSCYISHRHMSASATPFAIHIRQRLLLWSQARELARDDLIRVCNAHSGDVVDWLQDVVHLGFSKVANLSGHSQPRTHRGDAQFRGMVISC